MQMIRASMIPVTKSLTWTRPADSRRGHITPSSHNPLASPHRALTRVARDKLGSIARGGACSASRRVVCLVGRVQMLRSMVLTVIGLRTFFKLSRRQLSKNLDSNCEPIGVHGAYGAPFRIHCSCQSHAHLVREPPRARGSYLRTTRPIQSTRVPVYLGSVDIEKPYRYESIAEPDRMMFLSYGGLTNSSII